eukprot:s2628_g2.t1
MCLRQGIATKLHYLDRAANGLRYLLDVLAVALWVCCPSYCFVPVDSHSESFNFQYLAHGTSTSPRAAHLGKTSQRGSAQRIRSGPIATRPGHRLCGRPSRRKTLRPVEEERLISTFV